MEDSFETLKYFQNNRNVYSKFNNFTWTIHKFNISRWYRQYGYVHIYTNPEKKFVNNSDQKYNELNKEYFLIL